MESHSGQCSQTWLPKQSLGVRINGSLFTTHGTCQRRGIYPRTATAGILAGDSQANAFAKSVLYYVVATVHEDHPSAGPCIYVDDLAQTCRGPDKDEVVQKLADAGLQLYEDLTHIGCNISPKSMIIASHSSLTKRLVRVFRINGLELGHATNVRDVGISNSVGKKSSAG